MKISEIIIKERFRKDLGDLISLEKSIHKEGLLHPIVVDKNNNLVAGERRLQACKNLEWNEIAVNVIKLDETRRKEIDENKIRLDFTPDDVARIVKEFEDDFSKQQGKRTDLTSAESAEVKESRKKIAELTGWSHDSLSKIKKIKEKMEKYPTIKTKWEKLNQQFHDKDTGKDKISLNRVYKDLVRLENVQTQETVELPKEKYQILYADPPWEYRGKERNVELHYPSMTREDLKNLQVSDLAYDDSVMFMWITYPHLPEGLELLKSWGFTYKTVAFTWVKTNKSGEGYFFGLGNYTRVNAEICVIGVKGKGLTVKSKSVRQICDAPVSEHSEKPAEIRDRIVELFGNVKRVELFARKKADGWSSWGNEI